MNYHRFFFTLHLTIPLVTAYADTSTWKVVEQSTTPGKASRLHVAVTDADSGEALPFRAIVTGSNGRFIDGAGRNLYHDGRFFADAEFMMEVPRGETRIQLGRGPEYHSLDFKVNVPAETTTTIAVQLKRWISLADLGWFSGDNHVHAKHDRETPIRTDLAYAALQARAQGLNFVTEAGSNVSYDSLKQLNTRDFRIERASEIRPGPYVGHFNPPGLRERILPERYEQLIQRALPAQAIYAEVRKRGGVVIHTHPLMPRHQLHWMGATEAWSDAVTQNTADLLDVDASHTQLLWFAMLNLGNKIGVSGHTDAALGRTKTPSPGDARIYCQAKSLDYPAFVTAMRAGKTMATNGGPVFAFLSVDGHGPGSEIAANEQATVELETHSLRPLQSAELYQNGERMAAFKVRGKSGKLALEHELIVPPNRNSWIVARVQDEKGKWCLTSPVYFKAKGPVVSEPASAVLFEISNATRFADLSREFYAHVIVTVSKTERIASIEIHKDGKVWKQFQSSDGNRLAADGKIPVTGIFGDYRPGSIWHPASESAFHFQADIAIRETGWYAVHAKTASGREIVSSSVRFDANNPLSHALSAANLRGPQTELSLWGYGADTEHAELDGRKVKGSWWYPKDIFWRIQAKFGEQVFQQGWPKEQPVERFRD